MAKASDVAFSPAVKAVQRERGSRAAFEARDFNVEITEELAAFLANVDSLFLSTASADGQPYVQHRGGDPGFLRVVDEHTVRFVEERGNRQFITAGNLSENDRVCVLVVDYATRQRVKLWGKARVIPGKAGDVVEIRVTAWDVNCPKNIPHMIRVDALR